MNGSIGSVFESGTVGLMTFNESLLNFGYGDHRAHSHDNVENDTGLHLLNGSEFSDGNYLEGNDTIGGHPKDPHHAVLFKFVVNGLGITIVAILGIFGNGLSAIVLSRPQMKSSVTCLLLGLTFCDTMLISVSVLIYSLPFICHYTQSPPLLTYYYIYYPRWVPYLFPISITAQTGSVYLTLAVTIERYIAVCHSLRARSICTWRRARICVITVMLFSIIYNGPRWWEVKTVTEVDALTNVTYYSNYMSDLRADNNYITIYINWAYLVIMYLIPFSGLVAFNLAIYRQVRKANQERQVLSKLQRREMGLATMLLCVVVVFLLCNVLPLVNNIFESFYGKEVDQLVAMSNFLVVVNSSVNFVIYCTCGERFRRLLLRLCRDFLWCRLGGKGSMRSSLYRKSQFYRGQHGGDFEEVSLASVANNHTCLTTNGGTGNGAMMVDISGDRANGRRNPYRERNKTIPSAHNYQNHNSNGKLHPNANRCVSVPLTPT